MNITDKITITNECNMQLMSRYPHKYFDLAIVDLEYGIGASKPTKKPDLVRQKNGNYLKVKSNNHLAKDWDFKMSSAEYFDELFRISKNQIIFGGFYYGLKGGAIVWDKLNGQSDQFGCEIAYQSFSKRTDLVYYMWSGMFQGEYVGKDVRLALRQKGDKSRNEKRIHPTQKPVPLYEYLLLNYAIQGKKILDTHLGSGSIAIACHNLDFELTACELDPDYYESAIKRIKNHIGQQRLF